MTVEEEVPHDEGNPVRSDPTAQARRDKAEATRERGIEARRHVKAEVHVNLPAESATGLREKDVELHAADGFVVLDTHGEARFDKDGWTRFMKRGQEAFQVVA